MRGLLSKLGLAAFIALAPFFATAQERFALVIGNSAYEGTASLANPGNDAQAMAEKLEALGFQTTLLRDATGTDTISQVAKFNRQIQGAKIALFFFAGHGVQVGANSFLLPTDVSVESAESLRYTAIDAAWIVREMEKRSDVSLVFLDACRDNPFPELLSGSSRSAGVARGLGIIPLSGKGAIIAYAAAAGRVAEDGTGDHSPYTKALLDEIDAPGVEVGLMLRRVSGRVIEETGGAQRPELLVRLIDEVYLNPVRAPESAPAPVAPVEATPLTVLLAPLEETLPEESDIVLAEAAKASGDGRSTGERRFFGERPVEAPAWFDGLSIPVPTGWASAAPVTIEDITTGSGFAAARRLPLAALVQTRIAKRGYSPWYHVQVPTAGELIVSIADPPAELDLYARIHNANRDVVADWVGPTEPGAPLEGTFPVPVGGEYWITIKDGRDDAASADLFTIEVDFRLADDPFEPNGSIGQARPVPLNSALRPAIFPRGDSDWLAVWVDRPGLLTASATNMPQNLDVAMRVWNFNDDVLKDWALPARMGGDTVLEVGLPRPGQYFLQIKDSRDDAASIQTFDLALTFAPVEDDMEPNGSFGSASLQSPSGQHRVAIFPRGDSDWLALDIDHPGMLAMSATSIPENLDVHMRVWNANKDVVRDWFGPLRTGGDTEDFADIETPGRYFVEIKDGRDDAFSATSFDLALTFTPQPDQYEPNDQFADARPLTLGGEILFNILPRGDHDLFRIEAPSAGEFIAVIDPSPDNLDLHYRVYNADRRIIRDWVAPYRMGGVTEGFADMPAAGTYFLEIVDGRDDARAIEHAVLKTDFRSAADPLEPNNSFGAANPLALGAAHRAFILPRGDVDWYRLEIDRPGNLTVSVEQVDPALDVAFRLWTEDGNGGSWFMPARPGGPVHADIPIADPGSYRLEVVDSRSDARSANGYLIEVNLN